MKRNVGFALAVVLSLTVIGIAWAAWSATLQVGVDVVTAQGLDVAIVDRNVTGDDDKVVVSAVETNPLALSIGVNGATPGEEFEVTFKFENRGSVDVRISKGSWDTLPTLVGGGGLEVSCNAMASGGHIDVGAGAQSSEYKVTIKTDDNLEEGGSHYGPYILEWNATIPQ